jgi:hypothetical protein
MRFASAVTIVGTVALSPASAQQPPSDIDAAISRAERICLVGDRVKLKADAKGNLTITKLLPGGAATVEFKYDDAKGGQFFDDPQVQMLVERQTLECMRAEWKEVLKTDAAQDSAKPVVKVFTQEPYTTLDGGRNKSGAMLNIKVSVFYSPNQTPNTRYAAEWSWSGSGGTQGGSQTVI